MLIKILNFYSIKNILPSFHSSKLEQTENILHCKFDKNINDIENHGYKKSRKIKLTSKTSDVIDTVQAY